MKTIQYPILILVLAALTACSTTSKYPDVSPDGLTRIDSKRADAVYVLPEADLSGYTKVALLEPDIAFRKNWQQDVNFQRRMDRISDKDMENMIAVGKQLLGEEFIKELKKGGYEVVTERGPDVLVVEPAILDLDVFAPDPGNSSGIWVTTYSEGSGRATLRLELYDSVTMQLLVRAYDTKSNENDGFSWRIPRSQATNINDARYAFQSWARMLVKGLDATKAQAAGE
jgi:hypothetical protein